MPHSSFASGACVSIFFVLAHLFHQVRADCPPYSPFVPEFKAKDLGYIGRSNDCWSWAICVMATADEARKLQFAAIALVMGLIPLTLKDIAWPERRLVSVTRPLPPVLDTLVRALGPVPSVAREGTRKYAFSSSEMYRWANSYSVGWKRAWTVASTVALLLLYAGIGLLELYSKRSALGCVYPFTVLSWHIVALLPAVITTVFRNRAPPEKLDPSGMVRLEVTMDDDDDASIHSRTVKCTCVYAHGADGNIVVNGREFTPLPSANTSSATLAPSGGDNIFGVGNGLLEQGRRGIARDSSADITPIHGRGMVWIVPLGWAIYYVAGTLLYSSIMAVTVVELAIWVVLSATAAFISKVLALFICTLCEKSSTKS